MGKESILKLLGSELNISGQNILRRMPIKTGTDTIGLSFRPENVTDIFIKHRNLTSYLKKKLCTPKHVEKVLESCPQTSRHVGTLPSTWLENVPMNERANFTEKISNLFSNFAEQTSLSRTAKNISFSDTMSDFAKELETITGKKVNVEFLGRGTIGRTFKLQVEGKSYVIKTFYPDPIKYGYDSCHGKGAEICNAAFASKHAVKGQFAQFYFGKFARRSDNDGFLVKEFIDFKNARKSNITNRILDSIFSRRIHSYDANDGNIILDTVLDYGASGIGALNNPLQFKIERLLVDAINCKNIDKYNSILALYGFNEQDVIFKALLKAKERGVVIRGVVDKDEAKYYPQTQLLKKNFDVKVDSYAPIASKEQKKDFTSLFQYMVRPYRDMLSSPHVLKPILHSDFF